MGKGDETRARIIAKAAVAFNVAGFAGTAMSDIMRITGLEKGGIYRHFESKDELALAAFDYAAMQVRHRFQSGMANSTHAVDTLIAFLTVFRSYGQNPPLTGGCPILNTAIEHDDTNPELAARAAAVVGEWRTLICNVVALGIARAEIRAGVDGDRLALVMIATMEGAIMLAKLLNDTAPLDHAYDQLCHYINISVRQS